MEAYENKMGILTYVFYNKISMNKLSTYTVIVLLLSIL